MRKERTFEHYKEMLFHPDVDTIDFTVMRGRKRENVVMELKKRGLAAFNDKVYQLDSCTSRPLGHWRNKELRKYLNTLYARYEYTLR